MFWGPRVIINTRGFCRFWPVSWPITHRFGIQSDFDGCQTPRSAYMSVINNRSLGRFWPVSWTITHCFGVLEWFPWLTNPVVRLSIGHQHSQFWPILTRILDYYSLFWGPEEISIVVEPQCVITCRSSTLAVLANCGPFHGLLLIVLGSWSGFHG